MKFLIYRAVIILGIKFKEKDQGSVIKLILSMEMLIMSRILIIRHERKEEIRLYYS